MRTVPHPNFPDRRALPIAALGHGFAEDLLRGLLYAVMPPDTPPDEEQTCRVVAAVTALDSLRPRIHLEAMLAVQAIVCHHATMDFFRRANRPDVTDEATMRLRKSAVVTMRAMTEATRALERLQAGPVPAHPPDGGREDNDLETDTPAVERAIASALAQQRRPMDQAPMDEVPMDEAFVRERIARAHELIARQHGFENVADPSLEDPFSAEAIAAALRAHRQSL